MRSPAVPLLLSLVLLPAIAAGQAVPQPFTKPNDRDRSGPTGGQTAPPTTREGTAATRPATTQPAAPLATDAPSEVSLGAPTYPGAQYIASYSAGQGQRYYLFGTTASFSEVVTFYRTALRQRGELVFEEPATHMFEIGRFREETMAFPPGVTVKDYTWGNLQGYLNPKRGAQPARFPTVIQIVPAPDSASR
jgi:hypothetical protein